jgi:hypothetical protein
MRQGNALVIMAKAPLPGKTKTRLCPPFTPQEAARLYQALLQDTLALASRFADTDRSLTVAIAFSPPKAHALFAGLAAPGTRLVGVQGKDIGGCLSQALGAMFRSGYSKVLALSSDSPSLPIECLKQAFTSLETSELVFGPALDGGYTLVGMRQLYPEIFSGIEWSSAQVLTQSLQRAAALGLTTALTPEWYDIDTAADLERLQAELAFLPPAQMAYTRQFLHNWQTGSYKF